VEEENTAMIKKEIIDLNKRAEQAMDENKYDDALKLSKTAADAGSYYALLRCAHILENHQAKYTEALDCYNQALALADQLSNPNVIRGQVHYWMGRTYNALLKLCSEDGPKEYEINLEYQLLSHLRLSEAYGHQKATSEVAKLLKIVDGSDNTRLRSDTKPIEMKDGTYKTFFEVTDGTLDSTIENAFLDMAVTRLKK